MSIIFIFRVMGENSWKIRVILSTKMIITQRIKIATIRNLVCLSIQPIPDLSCKFKGKKIRNFERKCEQKKFQIFILMVGFVTFNITSSTVPAGMSSPINVIQN